MNAINWIFATRVAGCEHSLEIFDAETVNAGGAVLRGSCDGEARAGTDELDALLASAKEAAGGDLSVRWIKLSGMSSKAGPDLLRLRLAAAAMESSRWNALAGRPTQKREHASDVVAALAAPATVFPEGQRAFQRHGRCLTRPSVEDVEVRPVSSIPGGEELIRRGAKPTDRLPFSAVLWFQVAAGRACE